MKNLIAGILLCCCGSATAAAPVATPGAIASLQPPAQMQFHYDPATDAAIMAVPGRTRIVLSVLPATEPGFALRAILAAMGGQQFIERIEQEPVGAARAASVHVRQQTSDWWMVIGGAELNLFLRVQDVADAKAHRAAVEALARSVRLAPASHPALVSGSYTTSSSYSSSYGSSLGSFSESSISLLPDGSFSSSSYAGISGDGISGYSQGGGPGGWWQVRGNRILAFEPPESFYNYRFEAFSNGLELYDENGAKLLWVRK